MKVLEKLLLLIPLLPLIASIVTAVWGRRRLRGTPYLPTVAALMVSTLLSLVLLAEVVRETTAARRILSQVLPDGRQPWMFGLGPRSIRASGSTAVLHVAFALP